MCHIHTKLKRGLVLKKSGVPRGGIGLFTLKDIEKGELICEYKGDRVKQSEYDKTDSVYGVQLAGTDKVIDAASTQSTIGRYINDCRSTNKTKHHCPGNNTKFSVNPRGRKSISIRATKKIKKNKELFVGYGRTYWAAGKKHKTKLKRARS
jgi:SET domain-containing protein